VAQCQLALTSSISQVAFARVSGVENRSMALSAMLDQFRVAQVLVLCLAVILVLCVPYAIPIAFGSPFLPAVKATCWLVMATAIWGLIDIVDNCLRALGQAYQGFLAYSSGLLVLAAGLLFRVPQQSIEATAQTVTAAAAVALLTSLILLHTLEKVEISGLWGLRPATLRLLYEKMKVR